MRMYTDREPHVIPSRSDLFRLTQFWFIVCCEDDECATDTRRASAFDDLVEIGRELRSGDMAWLSMSTGLAYGHGRIASRSNCTRRKDNVPRNGPAVLPCGPRCRGPLEPSFSLDPGDRRIRRADANDGERSAACKACGGTSRRVGAAPEHTLASYRLALDQGADYVEQDLAVTKDGVLICLHDESLERTTNVEEVFPIAPWWIRQPD